MKKKKRKILRKIYEFTSEDLKRLEARRLAQATKKSTALVSPLKERLLIHWKGTPLEVKTLCWGPMQRDDEVGGKEMDSWLDDIARGRFVPPPTFSMEAAPRST